MTHLFNDPVRFCDEAIDGFVAANRMWVRRVPGCVARSTHTPEGQVAVVIGGGSGHYPAFGGRVGHGLASGAVMGNVFASASAAQVVSVAKAAEHGGGVLLTYGNYAGDVMNFPQAEERLRAEGIDCESVQVTDDISSAPAAERHKRRGVAAFWWYSSSAAPRPSRTGTGTTHPHGVFGTARDRAGDRPGDLWGQRWPRSAHSPGRRRSTGCFWAGSRTTQPPSAASWTKPEC